MSRRPAYYDTSFPEISYSSDAEYRAAFRKVVGMRMVQLDPSMDIVTADEANYDMEASSRMMDRLYDDTVQDPLFQEMYDEGAAKMMSTDRTIGMAVCFSYDYFAHYHRCICVWLSDRANWNRDNPAFVAMQEKII
jgi:hypothetical protein